MDRLSGMAGMGMDFLVEKGDWWAGLIVKMGGLDSELSGG